MSLILDTPNPLVGNYIVGKAATNLVNPKPYYTIKAYKRALSVKNRRIVGSQISRWLPQDEYFVSLKVDGEMSGLIFEQGQCVLVNPNGTLRVGLPCLQEAAKALTALGVKSALLACELYVNHVARPRIHDVVSIARNPSSLQELDKLSLAVFDILEWDGPYTALEREKRQHIATLQGERFHGVQGQWMASSEIPNHFDTVVSKQGQEGLMLSNDSVSYKVKPSHDIDAIVIGYSEGVQDRQGLMHDLLLAVIRPDGAYQVFAHVGGGFTEEQRRTIPAMLQPLHAGETGTFHEVSSDGVAYTLVKPEKVIKLNAMDVLAESIAGDTVPNKVVAFKDGAYHALRPMPGVSILSPVFAGWRDDKSPTAQDAGIYQIHNIVQIAQVEQSVYELPELPESQVLLREVYVKGSAVRKMVLWKTNKEDTGDYPAYVLYSTDYSAGRATPLVTSVQATYLEAQLEELAAAWRTEYVKTGWKNPQEAALELAAKQALSQAMLNAAASAITKAQLAAACSTDPKDKVFVKLLEELETAGQLIKEGTGVKATWRVA